MSGRDMQSRLDPIASLAKINDVYRRSRQAALRLRYNLGESPHPDLILSPYDRPLGQSLFLVDLPREILEEIASYLPVFWLLQFSTSCRALSDLFGFEKGNVHWYRALPPAIWQEMEQFQDEMELKVHIFSKHFPAEMLCVWFPDHYRRSIPAHPQAPAVATPETSAVAIPHHSGLFLSAGFTTSPQIPYVGTKWALYCPPSGPIQAHGYVGTITSGPTFVAFRAHKSLLGSAYDRDFNYRREIIGHLKKPNTCVICLKRRNLDGSVLALQATGYSFDMIHHLWELMCQQNRDFRLQRSSLETRRRAVRLRIIAAAEALWDGRDPFPVGAANYDTGAMQLVPHPGTLDARKYSVFRNRFAPTDKLRDFLFPPSALSVAPAQYQEGTFLTDPTKILRSNRQFADIDDGWVSAQASLMLNNLTNWRHQQYSLQGMGGCVDSWKKAATSWHLARLENEIESGAVYKGTFVTSAMTAANMGRCVHRLRTLLGYSADEVRVLPLLPDRGTAMAPEEYEKYLRNMEIVRDWEQVERERQRIFNKIASTGSSDIVTTATPSFFGCKTFTAWPKG
ncbi:hypothetical protein FGG08_007133 [Glutinoglossum americanum]|uniref:F-box domain-containing protein n=1 Tax=Glutinoglossum americanum TaxID=1670608 RepID=A0A9P8I242_9PEZI|nr:hypothetical protein FGG08_007133 [Glutinoglossum americanum]